MITFVVRIITTSDANRDGGELCRVGVTGYKGPGAPFGAPTQPTIETGLLCNTHKKTARAAYAPL